MTATEPAQTIRSHLTRGAWIEIRVPVICCSRYLVSHLTRGAWIEIGGGGAGAVDKARRTSHEVRGLKYVIVRRFECIN